MKSMIYGMVYLLMNHSLSHAVQIEESVKSQIKYMKQELTRLKNENKNAYLILGAANHEIDSLKDTAQKPNWMFWSKLGYSDMGRSAVEISNPYINADFNDKNSVEYASEILAEMFTTIIIPEEPIEYTLWDADIFSSFQKMLVKGGGLTFSLNWGGGRTYINYPVEEKNFYELTSKQSMEEKNGFHLPLKERLEFLRATYDDTPDINSRTIHFRTIVSPYTKDIDISQLFIKGDNFDEEVRVQSHEILDIYKANYADIDAQKTMRKIADHIDELKYIDETNDKSIEYSAVLRRLMFDVRRNWTHYSNEDYIKTFITKALEKEKTEGVINRVGRLLNSSYENWLAENAFPGLFSDIKIINLRSDDPSQDIPSSNFKRGSRVIELIK